MTTSWSDNARKRKLARQAPVISDSHIPVAGRKDTKRWCGGKQGRLHILQCFRQNFYGRVSHFYAYACTKCGKELDCWFDRVAAGWLTEDPNPKPAWVTIF